MQPKVEIGLSKLILCNFQVDNSCDRKQLKAEVKNGVAYKKRVSGKFSEMSAGTEKGQFGLSCGQKIQSTNSLKCFIMTKQIVCNRPYQILVSLYL